MNKITEFEHEGDKYNIWHPAKNDHGFCISFFAGGWMPGTYDSMDSAKLGIKACNINEHKFVTEIQQPINHFDKGNRGISIDDINEWLCEQQQIRINNNV